MRALDLMFLVVAATSIVWNGWHWHVQQWRASAWVSAWFEHQWEHKADDPEILRLCQDLARDSRGQIPNGLVAICMKEARARVAGYLARKGA